MDRLNIELPREEGDRCVFKGPKDRAKNSVLNSVELRRERERSTRKSRCTIVNSAFHKGFEETDKRLDVKA